MKDSKSKHEILGIMLQIKDSFSIFEQDPNLVYLDSTATTLKAKPVTQAMDTFLNYKNATIHRGVYQLSQQATDRYEQVRDDVQSFIGANHRKEIIFVKGTTEAVNLVANSYGKHRLKKGDEILITHMEHHANIVPWQEVANQTGAILKVCPIHDNGTLNSEAFISLLSSRTKCVAMTHISNVLGTVNPIKSLIKKVRQATDAVVLIDGAQAIGHMTVDVQDLDCDFYCFSAHKMFGPTGIGILYGKQEILEEMPPYQTGGDMIESVSFEKTTYAKIPAKFEAGTPAIAECIGLGETITFLKGVGFDNIQAHEHALLVDATEQLSKLDGINFIGQSPEKAAIISFTVDNIHPHDIGTFLDEDNIAVRVGHHCAQPLMAFYQVPATVRASFSIYNTSEDVRKLCNSLKKTIEYFA